MLDRIRRRQKRRRSKQHRQQVRRRFKPDAQPAPFELEPLEQRLLLSTVLATETFEYRAAAGGDPQAVGAVVRVAVGGGAIVELIGADIDDENMLVLGDIPGVILTSEIGREGAEILGGLGGADGVELIGETPIDDPQFAEGSIVLGEDNNIQAIASRDVLGNGETFGFNRAAVTTGEDTERTLIQVLQLNNATGEATVKGTVHQASLNEDVMATLTATGGLTLPVSIDGLTVDPTGIAHAVGSTSAAPGESHLFEINRITGTITDKGALNGGGVPDVGAVAYDGLDLFAITQVSELAEVDPTTGAFISTLAITDSLAAPIVGDYRGMAFTRVTPTRLFAVIRVVDPDTDTASTVLHEINTTTGVATVIGPIAVDPGDDASADIDTLAIEAITFSVNRFGEEVLVGIDHSTVDEDSGDISAQMYRISTVTAASFPISEPGVVRAVNGLGSFIESGDDRPLLFASDGSEDLLRGSSVTLPLDGESGATSVANLLGADFQPRIGNETDDRLFFVAASGENELDQMFHIDVKATNRSAVQNSLTAISGFFGEDPDADASDRNITTIAWDQTSDTEAILYGFDASTMGLVTINPTGTDGSTFGPTVTLFGDEVSDISGMDFPLDDPAVEEEFVIAVQNAGSASNLLRVRLSTGTSFILGPLPDPDDMDPDDPDNDVRGENIASVAFNPIAPNPFTGEQGVLLGVDTTTDELVAIDFRARFPAADVIAIYVTQAGIGSSIAIATVPDPNDDIDDENRFMQPFEGSAGDLRILDAQEGELIIVSADAGTGGVYIGARTEDIDDEDDEEDLIPFIAGTLAKRVGVRAAGVNDLPDDEDGNDLSPGLVVDDNLLRYASFAEELVDRLLGSDVDVVRELTVSRDGLDIYAVETDPPEGQFGDDLVHIPDTAAETVTTITDIATGLEQRGVSGLDFGDVNFDGTETLYSIMDVVDFVPSIPPAIGDLGPDLDIQGLALTPGGIMYAVNADAGTGTLRLLRVDRETNGDITLVVDLGDIRIGGVDGTVVEDVFAMVAEPQTGGLFIVGSRTPGGDRELFLVGARGIDIDNDTIPDLVVASSLGDLVLDDGGPITDNINGLAFRADPLAPGAVPTLYGVRDVGGVDHLVTIALDGTGLVTDLGVIEVTGVGTSLIAIAQVAGADIMIGIHDPGPGLRQMVVIDLLDPPLSIFINMPGDVPDELVALANDVNDLLYSVDDLNNNVRVSPGPTPTLGTIDTSTAVFTTIGTVGGGLISDVQGMAFSLGAGELPAQQGLFIIAMADSDADMNAESTLYEIDPLTADILVPGEEGAVGGIADARGIVMDADGNLVLAVGSFDVGRDGTAFLHDTFNGRLLDLNLDTGEVGANTATSTGSLRPTVGAIAGDFANNLFVAVDNSPSLLPLEDEAGSDESAVLMFLTGTDTDSPDLQTMSTVLLGGTVTGQVDLVGSAELFYAGWILTGVTTGQPEGGPDAQDNFKVGGDLRDLVTLDSIGTNEDAALDEPVYMTGFDLEVAGKVGQVRGFQDFIGSVNVDNQENIPNLDALTIFQSELEHRGEEDTEEGEEFEAFNLFENGGTFYNDTFDTAQIVGSVRSGILGLEDVVQISGELTGGDLVDYFAVPLMAGQTYQAQVFSFGVDFGIFDPDGRLIATNIAFPTPVGGRPFLFTADRPGLYRLAVGAFLEQLPVPPSAPPGSDDDDTSGDIEYSIFLNGAGDIGVGGLNVSGNLFVPDDLQAPGITVGRGDLGAILTGGTFLADSESSGAFTLFSTLEVTILTISVAVIAGDARSIEGGSLALPTLQVSNGSIGLLRANGGPLSVPGAIVGGDLQLADGAGELVINLEADGGVGTVRADSMLGGSSFKLNSDGIGQDGIFDLIDVLNDFGSFEEGASAIDTGMGGDVRYMRVGGALFQDPFFGGNATTLLSPGTSFDFVDDSGGVIRLTPVGTVPNPGFVDPGDDGAASSVPAFVGTSLTIRSFGIRGSFDDDGNPTAGGGRVLVSVQTEGSLDIRSGAGGNNRPVEIGEIVIASDGIGVERFGQSGFRFSSAAADDADGGGAIASTARNLHVNIDGPAPVDVFSIVSGTTVTTGGGGLPSVSRNSADGAVVGGAFRFIRNDTGGELVGTDIGGVGSLFNAGPIGLPKQHTGAAVNPLLAGPIAGLGYPFNQQRFGVATEGHVISIRSNMGIGNVAIGANRSLAEASLDKLEPNVKRNDDRNDDVFEGIGGPIVVAGSLNHANIGESLAPSGNGDVARAGLFVGFITDPGGGVVEAAGPDGGVIGKIVNQGLGSDIRGQVMVNDGIDLIDLRDGAIIDADIQQVSTPYKAREFDFFRTVPDDFDTIDRPSFEFGRINLRGKGGIIGSRITAADIGHISIRKGFGLLTSTVDASSSGVIGNFKVDGFGIRGVFIDGGANVGNVDATGKGAALSVLDFTPTVRQSENFVFDPRFGTNISAGTDLHLALGTSVTSSLDMEGIIDDLRVLGTTNLGKVSAYQIVGTGLGSRFNFGNSVRGFHTDDIMSDLAITTGKLGFFKPGSDVSALDMSIAGLIKSVHIKGNLADNSAITASGPNGVIKRLRVDEDLDGNVRADGRAIRIDIGGNLSGNITILGSNPARLALTRFSLGGTLTNGSLDIFGSVGQILTAGGLGGVGDKLTIRGDVKKVRVGTSADPMLDGASLGSDMLVLGDVRVLDVTGRVEGQITITGDLRQFNLRADASTLGTDLLSDDVQVFSAARKVNIEGGDVSGQFTVGLDVGSYTITDGDMLAGSTVSSTFGDIGSVTVRDGDIFGSVVARNGSVRSISILASDLGAVGHVEIVDANVVDRATVTVDDGANPPMTFEFDDGMGGGVTAPNTAVLIGADAAASADALAVAINAATTGLALTIDAVAHGRNKRRLNLFNNDAAFASTVDLQVEGLNLTVLNAAPAIIDTPDLQALRVDGSITPGTTIRLERAQRLDVGGNVADGADITISRPSSTVNIGGDMLGELNLGPSDQRMQLTVGGDLGGQTTIQSDASVRIGGDLLNGGNAQDNATLTVARNLEQLTVAGTGEGFVYVDGAGGTLRFGDLSGAVIATGFGLDNLLVDTTIDTTLVQNGTRRGDDGVFGTSDVNEDSRLARLGRVVAGTITSSVLASSGSWGQLAIDTMTDSSGSSGISVGGTAIATVLADPTPLASAAERNAARSGADRRLLRGNFENVSIALTTMNSSSLSAGVDPVDGIFDGVINDAVIVQHAGRALPDGGGTSRFGTVTAALDSGSFIVSDAGITSDRTVINDPGISMIVPNVSYSIADITANNPLPPGPPSIGTAIAGAPVVFTASNGETVTIDARGAASVAVYDEAGPGSDSDDTIDTLVITGAGNLDVFVTTSTPDTVDIGRVITADDVVVRTFDFDGTIAGDTLVGTPTNDVDLLFDGTASRYSLGGFGDDATGVIGGDASSVDIDELGAGRLRILGGAGTVNVVDANGASGLLTTLEEAPTDSIIGMTTNVAGTATWVFDADTRQITQVDPDDLDVGTGMARILAGPFDVESAFGGDPVVLQSIDFDGTDTLYGVANVENHAATVQLGNLVDPLTPLVMNGLAIVTDPVTGEAVNLFGVNSASGQDVLVALHPDTGALTTIGGLRDVFGNNFHHDTTTNFVSADAFPIAIPDDPTMMATSTINVAAYAPTDTIFDVDVNLEIAHTSDMDLQVDLISPAGTRVTLFSGVGADEDNFTMTTLDDGAATPIDQGAAPFTGSFQPQNPLAAFSGEAPDGTWTLEITDLDGQGEFGDLQDWSLDIRPTVPFASDPGPDTSQVFASVVDGLFAIMKDRDGEGGAFGRNASDPNSITGFGAALGRVDPVIVRGGINVVVSPDGSQNPPVLLNEAGPANFTSADVFPIAIPDDPTMMATSTIAVAGFAPTDTVFDVDVNLDITHTFDIDLEVALISPAGTRIVLFSSVGLGEPDFTMTTLDDAATTPIDQGASPFTGPFAPQTPLATFNGEIANGVWTLEITDLDGQGEIGDLQDWSLDITPRVPVVADGVSFDFTASAVADDGPIFAIRRDLGAGKDVLYTIDLDGTVTLQGDVMVGADFTNIIGMGFVDGVLVAATNDGTLDAMIAITDTTMPDTATLITQAGTLNTDLDAYAVTNTAFAYDFDNVLASGGLLYTNPGVVPTLVTVDIATPVTPLVDPALVTIVQPLAQDATGTSLTTTGTETTTDFDSTDVPKAIPDPGPVSSTIDVAGVSGTITDVDLTLDITHPFVSDLRATLTSPSGTSVALFTGVGGDGADFAGTTFDDEADDSILLATAPFSGEFRPKEPLFEFDGEDAIGTWTLELNDIFDTDDGNGTLNSWSLAISEDNAVANVAVDIFGGDTDVFVGTTDGRLLRYNKADGTFAADLGATTSTNKGVVISVADFDDTSGAFIGVDPRRNRLMTINPTTAAVSQRTTAGSVSADLGALTFDSTGGPAATGAFRGFDRGTGDFVEFTGTTSAALASLTAGSISRLNITGGAGGSNGQFITTDQNSFGAISITGPFSGVLSTSGGIDSLVQSGGDFTGSALAGGRIGSVTFSGGDFGIGGVVRARQVDNLNVTAGSFSGTLEAEQVGSVRVSGDGKESASVVVTHETNTLAFGGRFDGSMDVGSVDQTLSVGGVVGKESLITIHNDARRIALGGTEAGAVVTSHGHVSSATVGSVHSGVLASRLGMGNVGFATVTGGILAAGLDTGRLNVSGPSSSGVYAFGLWIGEDGIYNTADDLITGGSVGPVVFHRDYRDSVVSAGVVPGINSPSTNVQNRPNDNFIGFTGDLLASPALVDAVEAGGLLPSEVSSVTIRGLVTNTSAETGRVGVVVAADGIGRVNAGLATSAIAQRVIGDPVGAPTIVGSTLVSATELQVFFSELVNTGSLILAKDVDGNGSLDDATDIPGTVIVTDDSDVAITAVSLAYTTRTDALGNPQGVLRILRSGGFEGIVEVKLKGRIVDQAGFDATPTIYDRSGLRSVLRDFDQDGNQSLGEDRLLTILDGNVDGAEGGDFGFTFAIDDVADSFTESLLEGEVLFILDEDEVGLGVKAVNQLFEDSFDIDVHRFTADAFQFFSVAYTGNTDAKMGVFVRDDQGTQDDDADDTFEMLTRWEERTSFIFDPDAGAELFMAFELPPIEDAADPSGFRTTGVEYFVAVFPSEFGVVNQTYLLEMKLASTDTALGTLPEDELIAYISNAVNDGSPTPPAGSNNNFEGANVPKQLVYLNFDGGVSRLVRPGQNVEALDVSQLSPILAGLEDDLINGNSEVTGIVDLVTQVYATSPATYPNGTLNVQRFDAADLVAAAGDINNLPDGLILTTEDPTLFGFDPGRDANPDNDFMHILIGQFGVFSGLFGEASGIDYANLSKADEAIVFAQNHVIANTGFTDVTSLLTAFATALAGTTAHEMGHILGLNHTVRDTVEDDPNNDGDPADAAPAASLNLISAGPTNIFPDDLLLIPIIGTASVEVSEFVKIGDDDDDNVSESYIDSVANLVFWLS